MKKVFSSDYQGSSFSSSLPLGGLITVALFVALPFTQMVSSLQPIDENPQNNSIYIQPPPKPPIEPPRQVEDKPEEEDIKIDKPQQQLTLEQINRALVPGEGGKGPGPSAHIYDISDRFDGMIYEREHLDKPPVPLVKIAPAYPPDLKPSRIEGEVHLIFIVDEAGNVKRPKVSKSSNRKFNESAIKAIRQWKFEPGEKDGKKVKTRVALVMSFTLRD